MTAQEIPGDATSQTSPPAVARPSPDQPSDRSAVAPDHQGGIGPNLTEQVSIGPDRE